MSRGIKIFKVPGQYGSKELVTSTGNPQYRDIIIVEPIDFNDKMSVWRYNESVIPVDITADDYEFTDANIITNVTVARKAHQDDYRSILNKLKYVSLNKFGDTFTGLFDTASAKFRFATSTFRSVIYGEGTSLNFDYASSIKFNSINSAYTLISTILQLNQNSIQLNKDTTITGNTDIIGSVSITGNTSILGSVAITGATDIIGDTSIKGDTIIDGNLTLKNGLFVADIASIGIIESAAISADNLIATNVSFTSSMTDTKVEKLNADMLDGYHIDDIKRMLGAFPTVDVYSNAGTFTFRPPNTVSYIQINAIAPGGAPAGWHDSGYGTWVAPGGPGGAVKGLVYKVTAGVTYEIVIGGAAGPAGYWKTGTSPTGPTVFRIQGSDYIIECSPGANAAIGSPSFPGEPGTARISGGSSGGIVVGSKGAYVGGRERGYDPYMDGIGPVGRKGIDTPGTERAGLTLGDGWMSITYYDFG